jgi:uncharacterized membrane protein
MSMTEIVYELRETRYRKIRRETGLFEFPPHTHIHADAHTHAPDVPLVYFALISPRMISHVNPSVIPSFKTTLPFYFTMVYLEPLLST